MKDEDIEILDLDEEIIYTKGEVIALNNVFDKRLKNNPKVDEQEVKELKAVSKKKRKLSKGEKAFLILSVLFVFGCFVFYGYRTYYYYHLTHDVVKNITLADKLTSLNNIAYQNDGLYEKNGYFYYKGKDVFNYVYYSGRLFRIIDINNGIRMIDDETLTNLVWSMDSNYQESLIYEWLKDYLTTLKDYDIYLQKNKWCNEKIDIENYDCEDMIEDYVGLISIKDYLQAGAKNSYLNNNTYYWTINQDKDNNPLYINNEGNINNIYKKENHYFSYGIRPVITLKEDIAFISGDGSKNNPFIVEELGNALLKDNSVGNYVKYNNSTYRILKIEDDGISLIYDGTLEIEKKYSDVFKYLNNEFIKDFNQEELVSISYSNSEYSFNNKYELKYTNNNKNYVTIPKVGDLFLNEYDNYWLNNYSDNKLGLYYIIDENKMFFSDLGGNPHKIRPIIKLNIETVITNGLGIKDNPLIISEEGDADA